VATRRRRDPTGQLARRRVTSVDVARESSVSRATVSYVLNGTANQTISEATQRRVLAAAERLGYAPNALARALRSGRSDVVLFLIPEWPIGPSIASLIEHLSLRLTEQGLTLVVHAHPRAARSATELWKAIRPAVVVNHQALNEDEVELARRAGIPVIRPVFQARGRDTFALFQQRIGRMQAEHLLATGHRRLGFALPDDDRVIAFASRRLHGARQACVKSGRRSPVTRVVALDADSAAAAVDEWTSARPRVTAICAYNDEVAIAVLSGIRQRGLRAPADLAVVGVDNLPIAALSTPSLTTVTTGMSEIGEHLAASVTHVLSGGAEPEPPRPELIKLVLRESA
jgi:DNA-binding LacI/PurR family transcriptional regulator